MPAPARRAALRALARVREGRSDLAAAIDAERKPLNDLRDRALASEIALGTTRWRAALDHAIAHAGGRSVDRFDAAVLDVLRSGAFQLLHLDRIPASAAVDDAVDLCREAGHPRAAAAVNAILRRLSRERSRLPMPGPSDPLGHLSVTWSHPRWLAARWMARYGFGTALEWVRFNNAPAPLTLRVVAPSASRDEAISALRASGVGARACRFAADGLIVESGQPLAGPLARSGLFLAQDEASQLVGAFAAPEPGERVLDVCAAPGGKTIQFAAALGGRGFLVAGDVRPRRVRLLLGTLAAARAAGVGVVRHDALRGLPYAAVFDRVVVDAPCSSLGTIRRDPDVRWRRTEADLLDLAGRQLLMLAEAARTVRPGGRLVYAACSSEPEENESVVEAFLASAPGFLLEDPRLGPRRVDPGVAACLDDRGCLRTTPHQHGLEAFFAAQLRRV
ncbi:MAG TPA: 16S rRNA (cytosine(967)-C(5))-methyltransferase RsmB [Vicinamibacterales bacterium]|nr:16S rRNA (cytosine(967)-C(5))-methyltransferase RsmB [Vicinamibacterales bacterium]HPW22119.1 16S rRNA (cytosine(967)-C(5))-methyltransferase RsmB [Vicinamibacterales bacterium]